jgi:predicted transcriptional regulator
MKRVPHNRRADGDLIAAILAALESKPASRNGIEVCIKSGPETVQRLLDQLIETGTIEMFRAPVQGRTYPFYCLAGQRPARAAAPTLSSWDNTLARFREAVQEAANAGRDPFKVAE